MQRKRPGIRSKKFRIIGKRIYLRPLGPEDADIVYEVIESSRKDLRKWVSFAESQDLAGTKKYLHRAAEGRKKGRHYTFGIFLKDTHEYVGNVGAFKKTDFSFELGYWMGTKHAGKGYMREAAVNLIDILFKEFPIHRLEIRTGPENRRSQNVPEKIGFKKEGRLRQINRFKNRWQDLYVYGLLKPEWKKSRKRLLAKYK
ncbi:GNAT family N-acetyltransferase [Bdellovibrionota bacterium]